MATPFRNSRAGVKVGLDHDERDILVQLLGQLDDLLDDGLTDADAGPPDPLEELVGMRSSDLQAPPSAQAGAVGPAPAEDPALGRLLPEGNRDDPEASAEYRRLTEYGLRSRKRSGARLAAEALGRDEPVVLARDEALALLKAMTDVRLVLGERLELRTDDDAEALHDRLWAGEGDDAWLATASIYELLTHWQEHLVQTMSKQAKKL